MNPTVLMMIRGAAFGSLVGVLVASAALGQQAADRVEPGRLAKGAAVTFVRAGSGA